MFKTTQKGFTLIELLVVIAIVGILSGIAMPLYKEHTTKAKLAEVNMIAKDFKTRLALFQLENGHYPEGGKTETQKALGLASNNAGNIQSRYVAGIQVMEGGKFRIYPKRHQLNLAQVASYIEYEPEETGNILNWKCKVQGLEKYQGSLCQ